MYFEENLTYHIYNQGNNRQTVFFEPRNYLFFITKIREYILPHGDMLCYCLMPNHFHLLFHVNQINMVVPKSKGDLDALDNIRNRSLNESIAILLRSYTRAINKQEQRSGSLFRQETKAKNGIIEGFITLNGKHNDLFFGAQNDHISHCFDYIHQNPVKSQLVNRAEDWQYSSASDYAGLRNGTLCNKQLAKAMGLI